MKAYLLAAGYATRMYPLTRDVPKPLLEVAGAPILTHVLDRVVELPDVDEVVVVANARFHDAFLRWARASDRAATIRVLDDGSTADADKLGAIGDVAFALERVPPRGDWLLAAGDNLFEFGLAGLYAKFCAHRRPLLALRGVERIERGGASAYNEVTLDASGRVTAFREKPPDAKSPYAAIALYFFPARVADLLARYIAEGGNRDAPGHFIAWLVNETDVRAEPIPGAWFDVGSLDGLADARERFRPRSV